MAQQITSSDGSLLFEGPEQEIEVLNFDLNQGKMISTFLYELMFRRDKDEQVDDNLFGMMYELIERTDDVYLMGKQLIKNTNLIIGELEKAQPWYDSFLVGAIVVSVVVTGIYFIMPK